MYSFMYLLVIYLFIIIYLFIFYLFIYLLFIYVFIYLFYLYMRRICTTCHRAVCIRSSRLSKASAQGNRKHCNY